MQYSEYKNLIQELNTGHGLPTSIDNLCKIVLGKIARRKIKSSIKLATISTSGSLTLNLSTLLPDFIDFKTDAENKNRCIYYMLTASPMYFTITNHSRFVQETGGYNATLIGNTLYLSMPPGQNAPDTIYFPYYSKYLVEDNAGIAKEKPENDDDVIIIPSIFDDLLVDGVLYYIARKEKEDSEFNKDTTEWEKRLNDILIYN